MLNDNQVTLIHDYYNRGANVASLAIVFGVPEKQIRGVLCLDTMKNPNRVNTMISLRNAGVNTRLTPDNVRDIHRRLKSGERERDIAKRYGVMPATISRIKTGTTWTDIAEEMGVEKHTPKKIKRRGSTKLTEEIVRDIKTRLQNEESETSLARYYSVIVPTISNIKREKTWKDVQAG